MRRRRLDDKIVDGKPRHFTGIVAVFPDRGAVGVLHLRIYPEDEHRLVHGGQSGGKRALARMRSLFVFAENQHIDGERNGRCKPQQRVDVGTGLQLRRFRCDDQNPQLSVTRDERNGDRRLLGYPIGIQRLLAEIFHERGLFRCPGGANSALLNRCRDAFHRLAGTAGGDAHDGVSIRRENGDCLAAGRNHLAQNRKNIMTRFGDCRFA